MAASTRIKASNIVFKIGTTDYACDATMVELSLDDAPGDVQTFCETRVGGQWKLHLEGITSGDATSLYQVIWANFGTEVAFQVAPQGNTTPATGSPVYKGTVVFDQLPPLSLSSNETAKFAIDLSVKNTPHTPASHIYYGVEIDTTA